MSLRFIINMKITEYIRKGLLIMVTCALVNTGFAQETPAPENPGFVVDKIIAKVDNYIVIKSELERAYQDYITNGGTPSVSVSGYVSTE
jgi:peptidyl-prolyl cis-trans isomerase SurA